MSLICTSSVLHFPKSLMSGVSATAGAAVSHSVILGTETVKAQAYSPRTPRLAHNLRIGKLPGTEKGCEHLRPPCGTLRKPLICQQETPVSHPGTMRPTAGRHPLNGCKAAQRWAGDAKCPDAASARSQIPTLFFKSSATLGESTSRCGFSFLISKTEGSMV